MTAGADAPPAFSRASNRDWPDLWPIWNAAVGPGDTYTYDPATPPDRARRIWLPRPPAETWTAREPERIAVGTYLLRLNAAGNGAHVANAAFVVAPQARSRGIGRALAEHCLDRARSLGYTAMQFNAVVETNAPAVALWTSLGFASVGRVPAAFRHPQHGPVALLVMHRAL